MISFYLVGKTPEVINEYFTDKNSQAQNCIYIFWCYLGFRSVATDKMAEFIKIYNMELTVCTDDCIFIIRIVIYQSQFQSWCHNAMIITIVLCY